MAKIGGLGRGLDSLFSDNADNGNVAEIRISEIEPNRNQPRKNFSDDALNELSESIKEHGLISPILVRPLGNGYQIIAGERRWRASRLAGLSTIKAIVKDMSDEEVMEVALIENLQRENLNPIEEAEGYGELIKKLGLTQEQVAEKLHKSRSYITNSLRLLSLDTMSVNALKEGKISVGHAKALLSIDDISLRTIALKEAINGASVREIEKLKPKQIKIKSTDRYYDEVALALKDRLRRNVKITPKQKGRGTIQIEFYNKDELTEITKRLTEKEW